MAALRPSVLTASEALTVALLSSQSHHWKLLLLWQPWPRWTERRRRRQARHCPLHRSRRATEPLHAAFLPLVAASRSVCQVGRISPASAAGPHGYLSYNPLSAI